MPTPFSFILIPLNIILPIKLQYLSRSFLNYHIEQNIKSRRTYNSYFQMRSVYSTYLDLLYEDANIARDN